MEHPKLFVHVWKGFGRAQQKQKVALSWVAGRRIAVESIFCENSFVSVSIVFTIKKFFKYMRGGERQSVANDLKYWRYSGFKKVIQWGIFITCVTLIPEAKLGSMVTVWAVFPTWVLGGPGCHSGNGRLFQHLRASLKLQLVGPPRTLPPCVPDSTTRGPVRGSPPSWVHWAEFTKA